MKKRITVVLLAVFVAIAVISCAPKGVDKNTYSLGKEALSVAEQFTSGKIETSDAVRKLYSIEERLGNIPDSDLSATEMVSKLKVQSCVTDITMSIEYGDILDNSVTDAITNLKMVLQ